MIQNVLVASLWPIWVKIADFGVSKQAEGTELLTRFETLGYLAPEVLGLIRRARKSYTNAVDMWALGCIVHEILTLQTPFEYSPSIASSADLSDSVDTTPLPQTNMDMMASFCSGKIKFPVENLQLSKVSDYGIHFVKKLLVAGPRSRLSAGEALKHPWLLEEDRVNIEGTYSSSPTSIMFWGAALCICPKLVF